MRVTCISNPPLDAKSLVGVGNCDQPYHTAVALRPAPGKGHERAALAGDEIEVAADVLDARDARPHHDLVRRLPMPEVVLDVAAGELPVLVVQISMGWSGAVIRKLRAARGIGRR